MRTTVTIEPDVTLLIEQAMRRRGHTFKQVVNDAIRRGLSPGGARERAADYRVEPHEAQLAPGIDRRAFNRLADELDDDELIAPRASTTAPDGDEP